MVTSANGIAGWAPRLLPGSIEWAVAGCWICKLAAGAWWATRGVSTRWYCWYEIAEKAADNNTRAASQPLKSVIAKARLPTRESRALRESAESA